MKRSGIRELRGTDHPVFRYATYGLPIFQTYDGAVWCYIGVTRLLEGRISLR